MKLSNNILILLFFFCSIPISHASNGRATFDFYGDSISINTSTFENIQFDQNKLSEISVLDFYEKANQQYDACLIDQLLCYKQNNKLDDWLYYQLIRKTAQAICPKQKNFDLYTLYKWFLLSKSGYDAQLALCEKRLLFYVRSEDNIYDIPFYKKNNKQYVCLNYHDFGSHLDFENLDFSIVNITMPEAQNSFSYRVTKMPDFKTKHYDEKELEFSYENKNYLFKVKLNPEVKNIFANYPVVDFEEYFNIPLSKSTYNSLIPELREALKDMNQKKGIDYLMRFSRYAFTYENDQLVYGKEKRLSPEQTLLYNTSDCDDRAALFFSLVKEIYNLPMIVLLYPEHVTIAVHLESGEGKPILYKDKKYYVCEPTPQARDLSIGQISPNLKHTPFEIAYEYTPAQ